MARSWMLMRKVRLSLFLHFLPTFYGDCTCGIGLIYVCVCRENSKVGGPFGREGMVQGTIPMRERASDLLFRKLVYVTGIMRWNPFRGSWRAGADHHSHASLVPLGD